MTTEFERGAAVYFTDGPLGLMRNPDDKGFVEDITVVRGDLGAYECPVGELVAHSDDWHLIKVGDLFCPVSVEMFELLGPPLREED